MSKTGKVALFSFLLIASIVLLIIMFVCKYNIYLNEYNAQMQQLGYYKEDIKLFDQSIEKARYVWCLIGNVVGWVSALGIILGNIICGFANEFDMFW